MTLRISRCMSEKRELHAVPAVTCLRGDLLVAP